MKRGLKIVLIHQDLFFQGGEYVVAKLANGFAARGHEVHVIVSKVHDDIAAAHPEAKPFALDESIALHVLPFRRAMYNVLPLAVLLRKLKADVVLPNTGHYNLCVAYAKRLLAIKAPTVYVEHNLIHPTTSKRYRWALQSADRIIAVSKGVRQAVIDSGVAANKVSVVYNPVLDDEFDTKRECLAKHPWLKRPHPFTFAAAGALCHRKGFDWLIEAFSFVHAEMPEVRLVIFGKGEEESVLKEKIANLGLQETVSLAGFTDNLLAELSAADGFVLSSRHETFGIVLVEAFGCGIPVIAGDCLCGPREVLDNGRLGALVPVDDAEAMAKAMAEVAQGRRFDRPDITPYKTEASLDAYEKVLREITD